MITDLVEKIRSCKFLLTVQMAEKDEEDCFSCFGVHFFNSNNNTVADKTATMENRLKGVKPSTHSFSHTPSVCECVLTDIQSQWADVFYML